MYFEFRENWMFDFHANPIRTTQAISFLVSNNLKMKFVATAHHFTISTFKLYLEFLRKINEKLRGKQNC